MDKNKVMMKRLEIALYKRMSNEQKKEWDYNKKMEDRKR
jgi:hypothetical protein